MEPTKPRVINPKVISHTQLLAKKYRFLEGVPENILATFGRLTMNFRMIIYGDSGNGKSNLTMQLINILMNHGKVLYISLEEGHDVSMQMTVLRQLNTEASGKIVFADDSMTFEDLIKRLKRKRSEQFIVVDSVQYFDIRLADYKYLKRHFKNKTFIFISHAKGKKPDGFVAGKIEYDSTIKVRVAGYVAFIKSRLGGNKPYPVWEEGAKNFWGKKYNEFFKKGKKSTALKKEEPADHVQPPIVPTIEETETTEVHEETNTHIAQL